MLPAELQHPCKPKQGLYTHSESDCQCREVLVQWTTRDAGSPIVLYGTSPGHFLQVGSIMLKAMWHTLLNAAMYALAAAATCHA